MKTLYRDGVRHLLYCGPNGEREVHRYTASEVLDIFPADLPLNERGFCSSVDGEGIWIDLIFAGEKLLAEALS